MSKWVQVVPKGIAEEDGRLRNDVQDDTCLAQTDRADVNTIDEDLAARSWFAPSIGTELVKIDDIPNPRPSDYANLIDVAEYPDSNL